MEKKTKLGMRKMPDGSQMYMRPGMTNKSYVGADTAIQVAGSKSRADSKKSAAATATSRAMASERVKENKAMAKQRQFTRKPASVGKRKGGK